MLEAHIVTPRGSLFYAGEAHPYDLEMLWQHVHDANGELDHANVRLEIILHDDGIEPEVATWIRRIARTGVRVQLLFARKPEGDRDALQDRAGGSVPVTL